VQASSTVVVAQGAAFIFAETDATVVTASGSTATFVASQYVLRTGRSSGQTVAGGNAASGALRLSSSTLATQGKIQFGNSAYDEANNYLGLGTSTPNAALHIQNGVLKFTSQSAPPSVGFYDCGDNGAFGYSSSLVGGSSDVAGCVISGSQSQSNCKITFGTAYTIAPFCIVSSGNSNPTVSVSTTTTSVSWSWTANGGRQTACYFCVLPGS
jgi:hypothetical protein